MSTNTQNNPPVGYVSRDASFARMTTNLPEGSLLYAAPVAAQPDHTQQTLDDVKAGIPARDAEIEALRKEIEALQAAQAGPLDVRPLEITDGIALAFHNAITDGSVGQQELDDIKIGLLAAFTIISDMRPLAQQPVSGADGLRVVLEEIHDWMDSQADSQSKGCHATFDIMILRELRDKAKFALDHLPDATEMVEPSGNSGELPDAARVPLDSLHADAVYLLSRVKQETLSIHDAALSIQSHIDSARAALAQQDAETGKSVLVENQGVTPQTGHHCAEACHEWRQERTPCPKGQCKARNDADAIKYWGGKETWVRYLTDHTGLIQITARDIATCNAALDAVRNALAPGVGQQDADKVQADLLNSLVEIVDAVIASDEEGLIEHSETIIKARAAIDAARKEQA